MPSIPTSECQCAPGELAQIFPTSILYRRMPDADSKNIRLRQVILDREKSDPGIQQSNVGGWHSSADLWDWPGPEIRDLSDWVRRAAADFTDNMVQIASDFEIQITPFGGAWANVLRNGGYNRVHNHPGAVWSAVYYVATGKPYPEPSGNGNFEFMDPRPGNVHGGKHVIVPEAGMLMIFPAWLYHYVNPFYGESERISISWNMDARVLR